MAMHSLGIDRTERLQQSLVQALKCSWRSLALGCDRCNLQMLV
jgi:hypothetical protein